MNYSTRDSIVSSTEEFATLLRMLTRNDNRKQQIGSKRVRFLFQIARSSSSQGDISTNEDVKTNLWYNRETLAAFRKEALEMVAAESRKDSEAQDEAENMRGFEACDLNRQLQRHQTIQCILSAHKKGMTSEQTALIAQRCSAWNKDIAVLQALHDFAEVHQPNLILPEISNSPPAFPFQLKRTTTKNNRRHARRVRRRLAV